MTSARPSRARIAYVPYVEASVEKGYALRMREALAAFGTVVRYDGVLATWRDGHARLDAIVLNWTDNELLDRRTRRVALRKVMKLFAKTLLLRLAVRRLVFVRHNVYPHAVAPGSEHRAKRWVDRYERLFDAVLTHSGDEGQRARLYCPHPLYHRVVTSRVPHHLHGVPDRYFVVFGRVARYKRLERLMTAFPADRTLLVIGAIGDAAYASELARIDRPNVLFRPGLIAEGEAQAIVARSAGLLISHADGDVIVSSSFFFAMSLGVRVIAVRTPFLAWIAPQLPSLVALADDVDGLCALTRDRVAPDAATTELAAINRAFGDDAVHLALRRALDSTGVVARR